jgi:tripartite-type tricarboxylate transporter receptor subunit TctC
VTRPSYGATSSTRRLSARPVIDWLNREAIKAFTAKDVQERYAAQGFTLPLGTPEAFATHIATESKRWGEVIRRGKITLK